MMSYFAGLDEWYMAVKRVAVIGAGAAGLCAVRHLKARPELFDPVCFELSSRIGGTWVYTEKTGLDENGIPIQSSMYKNLRSVCNMFKTVAF